MKKFSFESKAVLVLSMLMLISGCATGSTIVETHGLKSNIDSFKAVQVVGEKNEELQDSYDYQTRFAGVVTKEIEKVGLFEEVSSKPKKSPALKVIYKFTKISEPNAALTLLGGGSVNSEIELTVKIDELGSATRTLADLNVSGNSKNRMRTSVGGVGITSKKDLTEAAMEEAAKQLAKYLVEHSRKKNK